MIDKINSSQTIILWGINSSIDNDEFKKAICDKTVIVINPNNTTLIKKPDLHVKIKEQGDIFFAMLLSRFLYIYDSFDEEFVKQCASDYEEYHELTQTLRIVYTLNKINLKLSDIEKILELIENKKTIIIYGSGIKKQDEHEDTISSINAFRIMLGNNCEVLHLDKDKYKNTFDKKIDKFEFLQEYDLDLLDDI